MGALQADRDAIRAQGPGYRPLIVGVHWPSLPWGDEKLSGGGRVLGGDDAGAADTDARAAGYAERSEEHTSELQSLMRISYAVFCLKKKKPPDHQDKATHSNNQIHIHQHNHTALNTPLH